MLTLGLVLLVVVLFFLFVNSSVKDLRLKYKNELRIIYDKLEIQFIKDGIRLDNNALKFLKSYKVTAANTDFLDFQVLWAIHDLAGDTKVHKVKDDFDKVRNSLSNESNQLLKDFDSYAVKLIYISALKPDFIAWGIKLFVINTIKSLTRFSLMPFVRSINYTKELLKELQEVVFVGQSATETKQLTLA